MRLLIQFVVLMMADATYFSTASWEKNVFGSYFSEHTQDQMLLFLVPILLNSVILVAWHLLFRRRLSPAYLAGVIAICVCSPFISFVPTAVVICVVNGTCP